MSAALLLALAGHSVDISGESISQALVGSADAIGKNAADLCVNREFAIAISRRIKSFVGVVTEMLKLYEDVSVPDKVKHALDRFCGALNESNEVLEGLRRRKYVVQLLNAKRDAAALQGLGDRVRSALDVLIILAQIDTSTLVAPLNDPPDIADSCIDVPFATRLPPPVQFYFGRDAEMHQALDIVTSSAATYLVILGGPGMGKTSLATALLHDPVTISHFEDHRYFVACDVADSNFDLLSIIAHAFCLSSSDSRSLCRSLAAVLSSGPSLLILDNFESAWEKAELRTSCEDALTFLGGLSTVTLILTMRGTERPSGIQWTRPMLPPLEPIPDSAARHLFVAITDKSETEIGSCTFWHDLGNNPFAVVLLANLAQCESMESLSSRWQAEKASMLRKAGPQNQHTSLAISIQLSINCPRMREHPDALQLLSLLSLLPQGAYSTDVLKYTVDFQHPQQGISTLLRTALASHTAEGRVRVLAPIREFILSKHPFAHSALLPLYSHYLQLTMLLRPDQTRERCSPLVIESVAPEIENVYSIMSYALSQPSIVQSTVEAVCELMWLLATAGIGSPSILHEALNIARSTNLQQVFGTLLWFTYVFARNSGVIYDAEWSLMECLEQFRQVGDSQGIIDATLALNWSKSPHEAEAACLAMITLATETGKMRALSRCHDELASTYRRTGQIVLAELHLEAAIDILSKLERPGTRTLGVCMYILGDLQIDLGKISSGQTWMHQAGSLLEAAKARKDLGAVRRCLGRLYNAQGDYVQAAQHLESAMITNQNLGYDVAEVQTMAPLIMVYLHLGDEENALSLINAITSIAARACKGKSQIMSLAFKIKGYWHLYYSRHDDAYAALSAASAVTNEPDDGVPPQFMQYLRAEVLDILGNVLIPSDPDEAGRCFLVAACIFRKYGVQVQTVPALASLARVVDDETAQRLLAAVMLPLLRFGFRPALAEALLHSASIALRRRTPKTALHRAKSALRYFEEIKDARGTQRATAFIETCPYE